MEGFKYSSDNFNLRGWTESEISKNYRGHGKFFESLEYPNKIIRIENPKDLLERHNNSLALDELVSLAEELYKELGEFGIHAPVDFHVGKVAEGDVFVFETVDRIQGFNILETEKTKEFMNQLKELYASVARYFLEKSKSGDFYVWDINGSSQYVYGNKIGEAQKKIYLIDTDMWFSKSRVGIYLSFKWLTRHLSSIEREFGEKFEEARSIIKEFIENSITKEFTEKEKAEADKHKKEIESFLNNEAPKPTTDKAIPPFE